MVARRTRVSRAQRRSTRSAAPVEDPAFATLKAMVIARTGHHYFTDKNDQLWERIAQRIAATGVAGPAAYLGLLRDEAAGEAEWRQLESAVTINETFFFRFAEQFDVLRRVILPRLIAARREERRLRIWSVGCSTGAEPYSLAILIDELLGETAREWRIAITGTDIDEVALETARKATYTSWSLRTLGEGDRARLFDREGDKYQLKRRYRGFVRFERHNLLTLLDAAAPLQFTDYDLVLCRNVLIYFSHDLAVGIVEALAGRLASDGYLFVGHAEPSPEFERVATPVEVAGVLAYRPSGAEPEPVAQPCRSGTHRRAAMRRRNAPWRVAGFARLKWRRCRLPNRWHRTMRTCSPKRARRFPPETCRRRARSPGAVWRSRRAIRARTSRRVGAMALGHDVDAEQGFRKALYLDNSFAMAHYLLGRHLIARGRVADGRRSLANAVRSIAPLAHDTELPEGDGMTAAEVAAAARAAMRGAE